MDDTTRIVLKYIVFPVTNVAFSLWIRFVWKGRANLLDTPIGLDIHRTAFFSMVLLTFDKQLAIAAAEQTRITVLQNGEKFEAVRLYIERIGLAQQVETQAWRIVVTFFALWCSSELVRQTTSTFRHLTRVHFWCGFTIPLITGMIFLVIVPVFFWLRRRQ